MIHEPVVETNSSPSPNPRIASAPSSSTSSSPPAKGAAATGQASLTKRNGGETNKQELKRLKSAVSLLPLPLARTPSVMSASSTCKKDKKNAGSGSRFTIYKANKASKKKREKSSAKKERKATKTLAIVLGMSDFGGSFGGRTSLLELKNKVARINCYSIFFLIYLSTYFYNSSLILNSTVDESISAVTSLWIFMIFFLSNCHLRFLFFFVCLYTEEICFTFTGVFLICWLPFFTCNIMDAICTKLTADCQPGVTAFIVTSWLGYMNSFVNPVIYTVFNPEFRKAFHKLVSF